MIHELIQHMDVCTYVCMSIVVQCIVNTNTYRYMHDTSMYIHDRILIQLIHYIHTCMQRIYYRYKYIPDIKNSFFQE